MDYDDLYDFIHNKMSMTHVYQPIMLKALIESKDNTATVTDIARKFLNEDVTQLRYYEKIVKRWPHDTLVRRRKVVQYDKKSKSYSMDLKDMTDEQKQRLKEICDLRLDEFIDKDPQIRKLRELDAKSISGSLRYDILSKCGGVCVACGRSAGSVLIDIDHIIPVSLGGKTIPENLQALCYQCNREKRNRDELDFIKNRKRLQFRHHQCNLCSRKDIIHENELVCAVGADSPLIMPKRHVGSFGELMPSERQLSMDLLDIVMNQMREKRDVSGFDITGSDSPKNGHYHINIIPKI